MLLISEKDEVQSFIIQAVQAALVNMPAQQAALAPDIITGEVLCERLAITPQTLLKWRRKDKIPYLQLGTNIRYDFNKVVQALEVVKKKGASK